MKTKALFTALMLLMAAVPFALPVYAGGDPILVCSKTADHSTYKYQFPADCNGTVTTLLPTGYETLVLDLRLRCRNGSVATTTLRMNFNGDYGANYHSEVQFSNTDEFIQANGNWMNLTDIGCSAFSVPTDANTGIEIIVPFANSTVFDKEVIAHSSTLTYSPTAGEIVQYDGMATGTWHRPSIGAVTVVNLAIPSDSKFEDGSTFDIYAR